MNVVIDAIPIGLKGNGQSNKEKADAFCHTYSTLRYDASHSSLAKDEVVTSALTSYNACKEIEGRTGVTVTHKFADPDAILVSFDFKNNNTFLRIQGVLANNMVCRSTEAPGNQKVLNENSRFEMRSNFVIACGRTHPKSDKAKYVPGSLAIGTNITSYTISLPADSIYNDSLASETTAKINGLQRSLTASQRDVEQLNSKLSDATKQINGLKMVPHRVLIGQYNPGGGLDFYGCGTDPNKLVANYCKGASQNIMTKGLETGNDQCGYASFIITCLYLGQ
jgi:hypothetical protein